MEISLDGVVIATELSLLPQGEADQIRAELEAAFAESFPADVYPLPYSGFIFRLPCGVKTEFDTVPGGVHIHHLHLQPGRAVTGPFDPGGLTIVGAEAL